MARTKGKSGGCRMICLHIPEADRIDITAIYRKGTQDDLPSDQRKALKMLAQQARAEAIRAHRAKGTKI